MLVRIFLHSMVDFDVTPPTHTGAPHEKGLAKLWLGESSNTYGYNVAVSRLITFSIARPAINIATGKVMAYCHSGS